jgi:hypothetical protein
MRTPPGSFALLFALTLTAGGAGFTLLDAQAGARSGNAADSAALAREVAMWAAITRRDSASYIRLTGTGDFIMVAPYGIATGSKEEEMHEELSECLAGAPRHEIDSLAIEHPTPTTEILAYRLRLDPSCTGDDKLPPTMNAMTVWVRRAGRWDLVARSITFPKD